jgi:replicative DNA helicase
MTMEMLDFSEAWKKEREKRRAIKAGQICTFGIAPLDDALFGMLPDDLVVIGADSAVGKSQLCLDMAIQNAMMKRQVMLYFLEGGDEAAMRRIIWKTITEHYYKEHSHNGVEMDQRKWSMNFHDKSAFIDELEDKMLEKWGKQLDGYLKIATFESTFELKDLVDSFPTYNPDLIIVDHLQYFDIANPKSELQEVGQILKTLKGITQFSQIPVVLVSHLRKKGNERGLPDQEDFYGTSNIAKIASLAITIAPAQVGEDHAKGVYPTFFRIVKSRTKVSPNLGMLCKFNINTQQYDSKYQIYRLSEGRPTKPLTQFELPKWAVGKVEAPKTEEHEERKASWTD